MTTLFRTRQSFLQTTGWQNQALNALHYNTSQQGSVVPIIYGTTRQQVNLIDLLNYMGPSGKKGKTGSLPITGTSQTAKGGGASKGKGSKKNVHFTVDVAFAICQGPTSGAPITVYSSAGVESWFSAGLTVFGGGDGQAADPVFSGLGHTVNYSGTAVIFGTPMDLGQSPVIPNLSVEQPGFLVGIDVGGYPSDANPGRIIADFLSNPRYGSGFPAANVSPLSGGGTYGEYCQAAQLLVSVSLDGKQKAIEWIDSLVRLTNSAMFFSGKLLKIVPYGDLTLNANGVTWTPNLVPVYSLVDDDFLPWQPRQTGAGPRPGEEDPILVIRRNPNDKFDWYMIEYTDRRNFYNVTTLSVSDQGAIDQYELREADTIQGRAFCNPISAQISAQLSLQRSQYVQNTPYRFKAGWRYVLLEPMDIVLLTGSAGDFYLKNQPVRIQSVEEDENGDLTFEAEEIQVGTAATPPSSGAAVYSQGFDASSRFDATPAITVHNSGNIPLGLGGSKITLALIANRGTPTGPVAVSGVSDNNGLTWHHRWSFDAIGADGVEVQMELWWADSSAVVGNPNITVTATFTAPATGQLIFVNTIAGPVNLAAPFDTNGSFPVKVHANTTTVTAGPVTTNSTNDLLMAFLVQDGSWPGTFFVQFGPSVPTWEAYFTGFAAFPDGMQFTAARAPVPSGVSGYTANPFYLYPSNSPVVNPAGQPFWLVLDAIAGT